MRRHLEPEILILCIKMWRTSVQKKGIFQVKPYILDSETQVSSNTSSHCMKFVNFSLENVPRMLILGIKGNEGGIINLFEITYNLFFLPIL